MTQPGYDRGAMLYALLLGLVPFQDPAPAPPADPPEARAPEVVEEWDDARAKAVAKDLRAVFKRRSASMRDRNEALEKLATGCNKAFIKPLSGIVERDKSLVIRRRAAELLGNQKGRTANRTIRKLIKNGRVESAANVQAELIRSLSRCGYTTKQWKEIDGLFEREYSLERVPIQEALLELIAAHKEKEAIPILLRNLDEPVPAWVDDPNNPPASYWEARYKCWQRWRGKVKEALFEITGQRFSTAEEAKTWLKKNKFE